jgi:hypothetical protein
MKKPEMIERIEFFKTLQHDWDSYGADGIDPVAIEQALQIVPILDESLGWFVAPCSDGSVLFEAFKSSSKRIFIRVSAIAD